MFKFSDEDLIANREGKLTSQQRTRLRDYYQRQYNKRAGIVIIPIIIGFVYSCYAISTFFYKDIFVEETSVYQLIPATRLLWLILLSFGSVSGWLIISSARKMNTIADAKLVTLTGLVSLTEKKQGVLGNQRILSVADKQFRISQNAYAAIETNMNYRIYFVEKTPLILAIEPLQTNYDLIYRPEPPDLTAKYVPNFPPTLQN